MTHLPLLPGGRQQAPASQVDLGPSILELAGVCETNSFAGHSLFSSSGRVVFNSRGGSFGLEDEDYSLYAPAQGAPFLYRGADAWQRTNVAAAYPHVVEKMLSDARALGAVTDYLYDSRRIRGHSRALATSAC